MKLEQMTFHDGGGGFYGSREEEINLEYVRVKIAKLTQPLLRLYTIYQICRKVADETRTSGCTPHQRATCLPKCGLIARYFSGIRTKPQEEVKKTGPSLSVGLVFEAGRASR